MFTFRLEFELQRGRLFFSLKSHTIIITGDFEDFGNVFNCETERKRLVADVAREGFFSELKGYKGHVAGVHGLNGKTLGCHVNVDHLDQIFKRVDDSSEDSTFFKSCFKHGGNKFNIIQSIK